MASNYWIKLYQDILSDPKMGKLSDSAWRRCIELFLLAGEQSSRNGQLPPLADIAWGLRVSPGQLESDLCELCTAGITAVNGDEVWVVNFEKRQAALLPAEKQKRYRDRERGKQLPDDNQYVTNGVTFRNAETEEIRIDTDKKEEEAAAVFQAYEDLAGMVNKTISEEIRNGLG